MTDERTRDVRFNPDEMTLGQAEFAEEYTGKTVEEFAEDLLSDSPSLKSLIAVLAIARSPDDPAGALEEVRQWNITEVGKALGTG